MIYHFLLGITVFGIIFLIFSIFIIMKYVHILSGNGYKTTRWNIVLLLIVFFIVSYSFQAAVLGNFIEKTIDPMIVISAVYFFGAVFVLILTRSFNSVVIEVLGELINDDDAWQIACQRLGDGNLPLSTVTRKYEIECEHCKKNIQYSLADVIRANTQTMDKGIQIQATFGIVSYLLRPTHKCVNGRREILVIHDQDLEFRAIDRSRLLWGTQF